MVRLKHIVKDYQESGAVNSLVNLFGFVDENVFLTKSGDLGVVLKLQGRDYECLDFPELNHICRRFEATLRAFDPSFRIYQYIVKRDSARIPHQAAYPSPVVREAVFSRVEYLESKADQMYTLDSYIVVLYEGSRHTLAADRQAEAINEKTSCRSCRDFVLDARMLLIEERIDDGRQTLVNKVNSFVVQLRDYVQVEVLAKADAFTFFRRLLNFDQNKADLVRLQHNTFS